MKIFKKQIPVRHILYVVLGWLHATMLCTPLYALVLNFVSEGMTKDVILQNILRGFLILAPITLSWFAIKCLRRIFFYILASIGITVLTGFLFDSVLMAVVALFICFMRLYGRLHGESYSLFDHAGYADLAVFAVPFLCSVFTDRADLIFQPVSLVFAAVYFVLCLTQRGLRRIDDYIDVNAAMQNMPARRIVRITWCAFGRRSRVLYRRFAAAAAHKRHRLPLHPARGDPRRIHPARADRNIPRRQYAA